MPWSHSGHPGPVTAPPPAPRAPLMCEACPHEWGAHDPIGTRFCAATKAGALDRGCVCVVDVPLFRQQAR